MAAICSVKMRRLMTHSLVKYLNFDAVEARNFRRGFMNYICPHFTFIIHAILTFACPVGHKSSTTHPLHFGLR